MKTTKDNWKNYCAKEDMAGVCLTKDKPAMSKAFKKLSIYEWAGQLVCPNPREVAMRQMVIDPFWYSFRKDK